MFLLRTHGNEWQWHSPSSWDSPDMLQKKRPWNILSEVQGDWGLIHTIQTSCTLHMLEQQLQSTSSVARTEFPDMHGPNRDCNYCRQGKGAESSLSHTVVLNWNVPQIHLQGSLFPTGGLVQWYMYQWVVLFLYRTKMKVQCWDYLGRYSQTMTSTVLKPLQSPLSFLYLDMKFSIFRVDA